jgi:hypothetical protein
MIAFNTKQSALLFLHFSCPFFVVRSILMSFLCCSFTPHALSLLCVQVHCPVLCLDTA